MRMAGGMGPWHSAPPPLVPASAAPHPSALLSAHPHQRIQAPAPATTTTTTTTITTTTTTTHPSVEDLLALVDRAASDPGLEHSLRDTLNMARDVGKWRTLTRILLEKVGPA